MPVSVLSEHSLEHIPHAQMDHFPTLDNEPNLEDQPQSHEDDLNDIGSELSEESYISDSE